MSTLAVFCITLTIFSISSSVLGISQINCFDRDKVSGDWLDYYYRLYDKGVACDDGVRTCKIQTTYGGHYDHTVMTCGPVCPLNDTASELDFAYKDDCHARCWKTEFNDMVGYDTCLCEGDLCNGGFKIGLALEAVIGMTLAFCIMAKKTI